MIVVVVTSLSSLPSESGDSDVTPPLESPSSCAIAARPPQHDTAGPRHRAFDMFQGSCYTILLPSAQHPARASKPSSATSVTGIQLESGAREETGRFREVKRCVATRCYVPIPPSRPSTRSLRGEEKSRESCTEEREDKSEARARVRGRLARRWPLWLRWQVIPAHRGIEPGSQEFASCTIAARPPQHDIAGPRHRAFDVFQGSCYTIATITRWGAQ